MHVKKFHSFVRVSNDMQGSEDENDTGVLKCRYGTSTTFKAAGAVAYIKEYTGVSNGEANECIMA